MRFKAVLLTAVCATPLLTSSQDKGVPAKATSTSTPPATNLQITAAAKTPFAGGLAGRAKCDGEGNIYFRPTDSDTALKYHPTSALPIRKIKPDGTLAGSFSIADNLPGLLAVDFFVADDGKVYQGARSDSERAVYVVVYSAKGLLRSKVRLEGEFFIPYEIAVFRSGEFLVSGIHGSYNRTPFTALYGGNGKLIKEIYEPEDEDARKRAEAGEPGFRPDSIDSSNDFVVRGDAALGSDGNAYLLRASSPALVYVISPKGEVIRKLRIPSPEPGLSAERLRSGVDILAISFLEKGMNTGVIEVVDYRGNSTVTYAPDDKRMYPGLLGCYSPKKLTFLSLEDGDNLRVNTAEPK
jgi:hypothetical protein